MAIDKQLRERCENPNHYDRMVKMVMEYSTAAKRASNPEEWATDVINNCISQVTTGGKADIGHGCVFALRTTAGKVRLFLEPLIPIP